MYNQNQNQRNNYGAPPNAVYHQDRRNFDSRRAPPTNQYGNNSMHGDVRRPPPGSEDTGPRPQRMNKQVPMDRKGKFDIKQMGLSQLKVSLRGNSLIFAHFPHRSSQAERIRQHV